MTNREAFNNYIRDELERKAKCVEEMSNDYLVHHTIEYPEFRISFVIKEELQYFKATHAPMPVGCAKDVIAWLNEEYTGE